MRTLTDRPDAVHLSYHGLDLARFAHFEGSRSNRDGTDPADPVFLLSVGRAVEKKGYDVLLRALALLPETLHWRFEHIGGGDELAKLKALASELGLTDKITWKGALAQEDVLDHYRRADLFALACRIAANGDRDGLPNVLVEASSQRLICLSTDVSGVPELLTHGENGLTVAAGRSRGAGQCAGGGDPRSCTAQPPRRCSGKTRARAFRLSVEHNAAGAPLRRRMAEALMTAKSIFFYVQHLLGIGHIARASRIANALARDGFDVTVVTGGLPVPGFPGEGRENRGAAAGRRKQCRLLGPGRRRRQCQSAKSFSRARRDLLLDGFRKRKARCRHH